MFKKRHLDKKLDLNRDLQTIQTPAHQDQNSISKNANSKKISKYDKSDLQSAKQHENKMMRYGLIQKVLQTQEKPKEENTILNLYIKMRMEQIYSKKEQEVVDTTASDILQMQKQYLSAAESKVTEYDVKQIQKKLEKLATEAIKNQNEARNRYFVQLLQNQHERMEYASKKELKVMKQERERLEKELSSKYASGGRRHYLEYVKQENFKGLQ